MKPDDQIVLIIGAGTMGAGIAQVAATHGWTVLLRDVDTATVENAIASIAARLTRLVEKERLTKDAARAARERLVVGDEAADLAPVSLVIEAIAEDLSLKTRVLRELLPLLPAATTIASNTSSLSITALGEAIGEPQRTVGMHFFNPAPLLRLVEVIAGAATSAEHVDRVRTIAERWGKRVARAADVPGFIVNNVARPYYLEAFRIMEDGYADAATIDSTMKTLGGFRMGPLELTDLIGQDVNTATTRSVWSRLDEPPLLTPSRMQEALVAAGHLGRKTGRGVYDYGQDPPAPAITLTPHSLGLTSEQQRSVDEFVAAATQATCSTIERYVFARILLALMTQASDALRRGVATADDIDTALLYGTNYPKGPFAWARQIGDERVTALRQAIRAACILQIEPASRPPGIRSVEDLPGAGAATPSGGRP